MANHTTAHRALFTEEDVNTFMARWGRATGPRVNAGIRAKYHLKSYFMSKKVGMFLIMSGTISP
jgi:hypothetical protein